MVGRCVRSHMNPERGSQTLGHGGGGLVTLPRTPGMVSIRLLAPAVALLAVLPVVAFLLGRSATIVLLSAASVGIIAASLYAMFGPSEGTGGTPAP